MTKLAWCALAVVLGAGCKAKEEPPAQRVEPVEKVAQAVPEPAPEVVPSPAPDEDEVAEAAGDAGSEDAAEPLCLDGDLMLVALEAKAIRICVDDNGDEEADSCTIVARNGSVQQVDLPAPLSGAPAIDDTDDYVEVCPPTAPCLRFRPAKRDGEAIDRSTLSADGAHAVVEVTDDDGNGRAEIWDLRAGRLRGRIAIDATAAAAKAECATDDCEDAPELDTTTTYMLGDAVAMIQSDSDETRARGTLYRSDGRKLAAMAGGSDRLRPDSLTEVGRTVAMLVDHGKDDSDHPQLVLQDLGSGRVLRTIVPTPDDDANLENITVLAAGTTVVLAYELGDDKLRLELIEPSGKRTRVDVPRC